MSAPTIGELDRLLAYQEPGDGVPDPLGQVAEAWATVATVWARKRSPTGRELTNAGQLTAVVDHVVTVRRAAGWLPKATGRFIQSASALDPAPVALNVVASFDPDGTRRFVSCLCTEAAPS